MSYEGKYLYCIIQEPSLRTFVSCGVGNGDKEVHTLNYRNLACVISSSSLINYMVSRKNLMAHEKVIEEVMKEYTVLPIRFGTMASSADYVRSLLTNRYQELKNLLRSLDNKIEVGLKAFWLDMDLIFDEISASSREIKTLKKNMQKKKVSFSLDGRISFGEKVKAALEKKRIAEAEKIIQHLKSKCIDFVMNDTSGDNMVLNSVFLIDRMQELEFDAAVDEVNEKYQDRFKFKYIGPSAPYNFVNLSLKLGPEE